MRSSSLLFSSSRWLKLGLLGGTAFMALSSSGALAATGSFVAETHLHDTDRLVEMCFSLSSPLDITKRGAILDALSLEQDSKPIPLSSRDLSLTPQELCLQHLQHERGYHLEADKLPLIGTKKGGAFSHDFLIPNREPSLSFAAHSLGDEAPLSTPPALEALNVKDLHLTLYQIVDTGLFPEAWRVKQQATFAPQESLTFARDKGREVWQTDMVLNEAPNQTQRLDIPLPKNMAHGLYFLSAAPRKAPSGIEADPKLVAGVWFAEGALRLTAESAPDALHVFATQNGQGAAGVVVQKIDRGNSVSAKTTTGIDGSGHLPPKAEGDTAQPFLVATSKSGAVALLSIQRNTTSVEPPLPSLSIDRDTYEPGQVITTTLSLRKAEGPFVKPTSGLLRLVKPDGSISSDRPFTGGEAGPALAVLSLPENAETGTWKAQWVAPDSGLIATQKFKVQRTSDQVELSYTLDRKQLESDGALHASIRLSGKGKGLRTGSLSWKPVPPPHAQEGDTRYGLAEASEETKPGKIFFMTGTDGSADIALTVPPNPLGAAEITLAADGAPAVTTLLPIRDHKVEVAIKRLPSTAGGTPSFSFFAIDASGKRVGLGEIYYQLYEDGRQFDWYQAEGRWKYRPLPTHHRISGGRLNLSANGETVTLDPLSPGHYVLETTDTTGKVLARFPFQAEDQAKTALDLVSYVPPQLLTPGKAARLGFTLKQPSTVSLVVTNGKTHQIIHQSLAAGPASFTLVPSADWGESVTLRLRATPKDPAFSSFASEAQVAIERTEHKLSVAASLPKLLVSGQKISIPVTVSNIKGQQKTLVTAVLTPLGGDTPSSSLSLAAQPLDAKGQTTLSFDLPVFSGEARLRLVAWNEGQSGEAVMTVPASPVMTASLDAPLFLVVTDRLDTRLVLTNRAGTSGTYHYRLTAPNPIKIAGRKEGDLFLAAKQKAVLPMTLYADATGAGEAVIEVTGPSRLHYTQSWPFFVEARAPRVYPTPVSEKIEVGKTISLPAAPDASSTFVTLIGPSSFFGAMGNISQLLAQTPYATTEVSDWLALSALWREVIVKASLYEAGALDARRSYYVGQILQRQRDDGSFVETPVDETGSMVATALALEALESDPSPVAQAARERAQQWIQHFVENTWFDEKDRADHALGFMALSRIHKSDLSALRYFADTCKDKKPAALIASRLALALSLSSDPDPAAFWRQTALADLQHLEKDEPIKAWQVLSILANEPEADRNALSASADRLSQKATGTAPRAALRTIAALNKNAAAWTVALNGNVKKQQGFMVLSAADRHNPISVLNKGETTLFALTNDGPAPAREKDATSTVQQRLYQTDGGLLNGQDPLQRGSLYIMEFSGLLPKTGERVVFQSAPSAGMHPVVPSSMKATMLVKLYPWLGEDMSNWLDAKWDGARVNFVLPADDEDRHDGRWRVAYPVIAERAGVFTMPTVRLRSVGISDEVTEAGTYQLKIK